MAMPLSLVWDLIAHDGASPTFARVSASADKAAIATDRAAVSTTEFGKKAGLALAAVAGVGAVIVGESLKAAMTFQQATNVYVTAAGESVSGLAVVRKGIENIAASTGTSIKNLTDAEYLVEKAGDHGADGLKILTAAAQGAREENAQLSDVVQAMTSVMTSYHLSADQSVQVMNALKTGAGSAKVTMEDYAKSLSTVIPVASAAGISLSQTLGAISMLTQHGTSADEATQELSNTIRNLVGPNHVATVAMQQLGLSTVDVMKNLGTRGLTGTIELVTDAIQKKMGPAGLVAVDAFRQSQSATQDLNIELSKMPKSLSDVSAQFESGAISYKTYLKDVKGLGGAQFELGKAFIATMSQAKGFNTLLAAGSPAATTFAGYLKTVMGGANGLNVALQLGGQNMAQFKSITDAVGTSLNDGAKQVEGWASTQKLASVEADRAKESLHVLGIELGTALLPAATKVFTWIATDGVDSLKSIGKFAVDERDPLVALGGAVVGMWATWKAYTIVSKAASAVRLAYASMSTAVTTFAGLFTESEAVIAAQTAASEALQAQSVAEFRLDYANKASAAATAAEAIAVSLAGTDSVLAESAASEAATLRGEATQFRLAAVAAEEYAATTATAATTAATVVEEEGVAAGAAWKSILGPVGLIAGLAAGAIAALHLFGGSAHDQIKPTQELTDAIRQDGDAFGKTTQAMVANTLQSEGLFDAGRKLGLSQQTVMQAALGNAAAQSQVSAALVVMTPLMRNAYGQSNAQIDATNTLVTASKKLSDGLGTENSTLAANKTAAENVNAALKPLPAASNAAKVAADGHAAAVGALSDKFSGAIDKSSGLNAALAKLNAQKTTINVDVAAAMANVRALANAIASLPGSMQGSVGHRNDPTMGHAAGGTVRGPGTGTSDSILARVSNGEYIVKASQTAKHKDLLHAINSGAGGFANGGLVTAGLGIGASRSSLVNSPALHLQSMAPSASPDISALIARIDRLSAIVDSSADRNAQLVTAGLGDRVNESVRTQGVVIQTAIQSKAGQTAGIR